MSKILFGKLQTIFIKVMDIVTMETIMKDVNGMEEIAVEKMLIRGIAKIVNVWILTQKIHVRMITGKAMVIAMMVITIKDVNGMAEIVVVKKLQRIIALLVNVWIPQHEFNVEEMFLSKIIQLF